MITDLDAKIEYVNPRFTQITGYSSAEALGKRPSILKTDLTPVDTYRSLWSTIRAGREWRGEFVNRKGVKAASYDGPTLATRLQDKSMVMVDYANLYDRSMENIIENLRH